MSISNPVEQSIRKKLTEHLGVSHLEVINESYMHNVPKGSETHFKVVVVSDKFDNTPLLKVESLANEMAGRAGTFSFPNQVQTPASVSDWGGGKGLFTFV
ncbi:unnamed protein product [Callosobruchus maculatus]|uniref:Uncharacterized protein n=1 Tax=Callosobruchus maculatus TaxID=64391 RepID=A0A653BVA4_CALMS|nr:unnamed protein product [Callosobruchus maculatus]